MDYCFVGLLKFWSKAGRVSSSLPEASTSQDASNFGDSFWLLDPSLPTIRLFFLSPSSILHPPICKGSSERVITSRGMTQQGEDINSATEGRVSRD
ncbi:unnamed protein product [Brassica oleracea var. botrytis]